MQMNSFEIYRIAMDQWKKAREYQENINFGENKKGKIKSTKERKKQNKEYEKAVFFFKLYKSVSILEEREFKNE